MKLVWKIVLPLPVVAAAVAGGAFLLPQQVEVEHRVVLPAAPEQVFPYLNNPTEWPKWTTLNKESDPTVIHLYGGPVAGVGARMQWSGDKVGDGRLQLTESVPSETVAYEQNEATLPDKLYGYFSLHPVNGGTEVIWRQKAVVGKSPLDRYRGYYQQRQKQREVEQGLEGLKTLLQKNSKRRASR